MRKKSILIFVFGLILAWSALGGYVAAADEAEAEKAESVSEQAADAVSAVEPAPLAGMTVSIDPETGGFRAPTAEEAAVFSAAMQEMFAGNQVTLAMPVTHRNGMISVQLGFEHMDFSVAHKGDDGKLHYNCVDDHGDATQLINTQTAQPEEK